MSEKARRVQRVEKELRQIISSYFVKIQSGSSGNLVTVTNVVASPDLRPEAIIEDSQSHAVQIQKEISRHMRMKYCPKLFFYNDDSIALFAKIDAQRSSESED